MAETAVAVVTFPTFRSSLAADAKNPALGLNPVVDELEKGNEAYYRRAFNLALKHYLEAERLAGGMADSDPTRIRVRMHLADVYYELHRFQKAEVELIAVTRQPLHKTNENPVSATLVWVKLAKVYLGIGDAVYRSASSGLTPAIIADLRSKYDQILLGGANVNPNSPLYQYALLQMRPDIQRIMLTMSETEPNLTGIHAEIVAIICDTYRRFDQIKAGLNYLGYSDSYVPILSFDHLRDVSRSFAQIAAQANREYLGYLRKIEDDTFTLRQLEQAVEVNRAGVDAAKSATEAARREADAAEEAEELAELRRRQAAQYVSDYNGTGYDLVLLEEALAWAQATVVPHDEQIKLQYEGVEHLGIAKRYQPRSQLIQELTVERARLSHRLQVRRLQQQVEELAKTEDVARRQTEAAVARAKTASLTERAAAYRLRHSQQDLEAMREKELGTEFFSYMASQVRESALIYLEHATLIAFMMERAYQFLTGLPTRRIRFDYGDLEGPEGIYAADLLLRDIDYFVYERIASAGNKAQPATRMISLSRDYPLEFLKLLSTGSMRFTTLLSDFQREHPGLCNGRVMSVLVRPIGLIGSRGPVGRLTSAGVSSFRDRKGNVLAKVHPSESLMLSAYDARADRGLADVPFEQLGVFENIGLATDWLLELPQRRNTFDVHRLTDVTISIAYLGEIDPELSRQDEAAANADIEAQTRFSIWHDFTSDAIYALESGDPLEFTIDADRLPRNHHDPRLVGLRLVALAAKDGAPVPLTVTLASSAYTPPAPFSSGSSGVIVALAETQNDGFRDTPLLSRWSIAIPPALNPGLAITASGRRRLNLRSIADLYFVPAYRFQP